MVSFRIMSGLSPNSPLVKVDGIMIDADITGEGAAGFIGANPGSKSNFGKLTANNNIA